jgi:isoleucyl-tRNA synthetase
MEYKDTLNLPRTDFPMRANLAKREPELLATWQAEDLYRRMLDCRADSPTFLLHDGPPYANGEIHLGHALNKVLKDIVLKYKHLAGFRVPYRPGWDCHGLPIELEVEKKLGREQKLDMDVLEVRRRCREYAEKFVGIQREDFIRLGVQADWDNPYLTLKPEYEAAQVREFAGLIRSGGLYRGRKPVHWCVSCRTALAEAEVEHADHRSTSVYVAFSVPEPSGPLAPFAAADPAIAIWTTTPWTLPANLAIAVNPQFTYVAVEHGDSVLVVAEEMLGEPVNLKEKLGLGAVLATFSGSELEGTVARHPWIERDSIVIAGDHVTLEAGTGCVHTAPGHGHDDYIVGQRYGLEPYAPVDASGLFTSDVPEYEGRFVFKCDSDIVERLRENGSLLADHAFDHTYPHCWRCKNPIVFRATDQWFLSMDEQGLRKHALEAIDQTQWIPSWGRERIYGMVANRPDWCLSRQRVWGVPVVALRCKNCGGSCTDERLALHAAELFETEGSDAWYARPIEDLIPDGFACSQCGMTEFERESDILDVWFDSAVSYAAVIEKDEGAGTIADLYLEGSDQHRGWFHSSLLTSVATRGHAPYKAVMTHGFVLDGDGRKMSKSMGNVTAPQKIIKQYGADILRLWVAAEDYRDDVRISGEILKRTADSYRRIRNTARNLLGNLNDFDAESDGVELSRMLELDRWALARLHEFVGRCREAYDSYEFHTVYHALNNFCAIDLSAQYFDIVKDRLYCSGRDSLDRRSAQTAMYGILNALVRVIAPILAFTADEIWRAMPSQPQGSVFTAQFEELDDSWNDSELLVRWGRIWELRGEITRSLEEKRKSGDIGHSLDARVRLSAPSQEFTLLDSLGRDEMAAICIVSQFELVAGDRLSVEVLDTLGGKCGRCWNYSESVGSHADHPDVCDRCHGVVVTAV